MIFSIITISLIVLIIVLSIYLIREYLVYIDYFTIEPPKDRKELKALNQRRQVQKHRVSNTAMIVLTVFVLVVSFMLFNLMSVKNDTDKIKDQVTIEKKKNSVTSISKDDELKKYKGDSWDISQFSWENVLKNESGTQIDNEIALSKKLMPYIGENSVTIIRGTSLTLSIFAVGLTLEQFNKAQENMVSLKADLNKVPQISIVDFTFTYYNDKGEYQKVSQLYYQEDGVLKDAVKK
ncbi:hypothetical protein I6N95_23040 [Vagococcus sp. BWB3-3]|uniref:Uncharacterized protein n=1 Tax=Vagococcus allomyrinae TaxID=2794353 RepID=A0A940P8Y0_9ENTE|nr:hypothetical protein [Vagococcus allomyrinae]MBP1043909.1 hypothetical protein [Vagococcus allomyrinae]